MSQPATSNHELLVVAEESGLERPKVEVLLSSFGEDWQTARELVSTASGIEVSDESQVSEMQRAREARLALKKVRLNTELTRKSLKEQSLREGKAIDGMANIIKAVIVPVEEHLETLEKFAETKAAERKAARHAERIEQLSKYVPDVSIYSLADMSDETFQNLLELSRQAFASQKEAERQMEIDRDKEKAEKEAEDERIRKENERLKAEQAEKDKKATAERVKLQKENEAKEAERKKEREAEAKKLDEERAARKKLEDEREAERKAKEATAKADEERKRKALLAPDKEKLLAYANQIDLLPSPPTSSEDAAALVRQTKELLARVSNNLRTKAQEL
jgi:hypothetical protein